MAMYISEPRMVELCWPQLHLIFSGYILVSQGCLGRSNGLSVRVFVAVSLVLYITIRLNLVPGFCLESPHADPDVPSNMERGF